MMMMMMMMRMVVMMMMMMVVKGTPAHVHGRYSSSYNMLLLTEYISWHVTFGLHTGPLSDTLKRFSRWATAAESSGGKVVHQICTW